MASNTTEYLYLPSHGNNHSIRRRRQGTQNFWQANPTVGTGRSMLEGRVSGGQFSKRQWRHTERAGPEIDNIIVKMGGWNWGVSSWICMFRNKTLIHGRAAPIPVEKRTDPRIYQMFWLWFSVNFNILAFSTGSAGPAFFGLGLRNSLLILLVVDVMCVLSLFHCPHD